MKRPVTDRRNLLKWLTPVVTAVVLPSHAQTSSTTTAAPPTTTAVPTTTAAPRCVNNVIERDVIPEMPITWSDNMSVAQYSGPGSLSEVIVRVYASVRAEVGIENEDQTAQTYTANLNASIDVTGPASLTVPITDSRSVDLGAIDGVLDFAGTAGTSFTITTGEQMSTTSLAPASFVGTGMVAFTADAAGAVTIMGSAFNTSQIRTFAQARIEVEYVCA